MTHSELVSGIELAPYSNLGPKQLGLFLARIVSSHGDEMRKQGLFGMINRYNDPENAINNAAQMIDKSSVHSIDQDETVKTTRVVAESGFYGLGVLYHGDLIGTASLTNGLTLNRPKNPLVGLLPPAVQQALHLSNTVFSEGGSLNISAFLATDKDAKEPITSMIVDELTMVARLNFTSGTLWSTAPVDSGIQSAFINNGFELNCDPARYNEQEQARPWPPILQLVTKQI